MTELLPPKGVRLGGPTMPRPMNSTGQPTTNHRLQTVVV